MESIEGGAMSLREITDAESAPPRTSAAKRRGTLRPHNNDDRQLKMSTAALIRELAVRESDGIHIALLWHPNGNTLSVSVEDARVGDSFQLAVAPERALDAFYHPFAYAA
jgi:hypothetical protein